MKGRKLAEYAEQTARGPLGRILVFTGARQTGKTTLARSLFPGYEYLSIEDPVVRREYAALTAAQWKSLYPRAILDEVQKEPRLIESVKSVYDQWPEPKYILIGSSQFLLMEQVRESLAGRCVIIELFPLTLPEMETGGWDSPVPDSPLQRFAARPETGPDLLPSFLLDRDMARKKQAWDHYLKFGAYPALTNPALSDEERYTWQKNYVRTYLERDIRDLASFRDLEPLVVLQQYLAQYTAQLMTASAAAAELGVSVKTVQRYIRYFEMSYQILLLPAWSRNVHKRLTKSAKLHYLDQGILRAVLQKQGGTTGAEFESLVAAEIYKQIRSARIPARLYHIRTHDGFEVDLLIELEQGYIGVEIKMAEKVSPAQAKHLRNLGTMLDKPLLHSFIVSQDPETKHFAPGITAVHGAYLLG